MLKEESTLLPGGMNERYTVEQFVGSLPADPRPLLSDNLRRRQTAEIESARAVVTSYGMNPDEGHAPSMPAPANETADEDLPAHLAKAQAQADAGPRPTWRAAKPSPTWNGVQCLPVWAWTMG